VQPTCGGVQHPATVFENARLLLQAGVHTVVGATGLTAAQVPSLPSWRAGAANLLVAPNFCSARASDALLRARRRGTTSRRDHRVAS